MKIIYSLIYYCVMMKKRKSKGKIRRLPIIFGGIGIILMILSAYLFFCGPTRTTTFQNSQDVWDPAEPKGVFFFEFSSQGLIVANKPVHVKIVFFITQGLNISDLLPLTVVLPDAYAYPLKPDPQGVTYVAGEIEIKPAIGEGPASGESDVTFPQSGKFGYILFSKGEPVYVTVFDPYFYPVVEVEPASVWIFAHAIDSFLVISLLECGLFLEIIVFRPYIEVIGGKKRLPHRSLIGIYVILTILFSFVVYFAGTTFFGMSDGQAFSLVVPSGVVLFVGLLRYSR